VSDEAYLMSSDFFNKNTAVTEHKKPCTDNIRNYCTVWSWHKKASTNSIRNYCTVWSWHKKASTNSIRNYSIVLSWHKKASTNSIRNYYAQTVIRYYLSRLLAPTFFENDTEIALTVTISG
jgi:hypothetical protein